MKAQINFYKAKQFDLCLSAGIKEWLSQVIQTHKYNYTEINYTFCSDDELLDINKSFLDHDFYTDIITFDNSIHDMISADIMISVDRVKDNALQHNVEFNKELHRVMVHGLLHCMGYNDNNEETSLIMRKKEDEALNMFHVEHNRI